MSSHAQQPSPQQIKPLIENHQAMWVGLTKAMTVGVIGIVILLALMALFLVKPPVA